MGTIRINTDELKSASQSLSLSAGTIQNLSAAIAAASAIASPIMAVRGSLGGRLSSSAKLVGEIQSDVQRLSSTVLDIAASYESTEASLVKQGDNWKKGSIVGGGAGASGGGGGGSRGGDSGGSSVLPGVVGAAIGGAGILGGQQAADSKNKQDSWRTSFKTDAGNIEIEGDSLHAESSSKTYAKWDIRNKDLYVGVEGKVKGSLLHGKVKGGNDYSEFEATADIGYAEAQGTAKAYLFKDGVFDPAVALSVSASASVLKGDVGARMGSKDFNMHSKAEGSVGTVEAKGEIKASKNGFAVSGTAEICAAKGKVSGGITLFGIKIDVGLEGKVGNAGVDFSTEYEGTGLKGRIGGGLGLGAGLEVNIDWSKANFSVDKTLGDIGKGIEKLWNGFR